jgi:hypothetical protein
MTGIKVTNEDDAAYLREYDDLCDRVAQMTDRQVTVMMFFVAGYHFAAELDKKDSPPLH